MATVGNNEESLAFSPFVFPSTELVVDGGDGDLGRGLGAGTFEVRESEIAWSPNADPPSTSSTSSTSSSSRVVPFRAVSLSAVAQDASGRQCLYLQIDGGPENGMGAENGHGGHDDIGEEDPFEALKEWNLVFGSEEDLQKAFQAMCDGALRNPDSDEEGEEDWEGEGGEAGLGGWFTAGSLAEEDEGLEGVPGSQGAAAAALEFHSMLLEGLRGNPRPINDCVEEDEDENEDEDEDEEEEGM